MARLQTPWILGIAASLHGWQGSVHKCDPCRRLDLSHEGLQRPAVGPFYCRSSVHRTHLVRDLALRGVRLPTHGEDAQEKHDDGEGAEDGEFEPDVAEAAAGEHDLP